MEKNNSNKFSRNDEKTKKNVISVNNNKKKRKVVDSVKIIKNRTLIIVFSNCGEIHLMNHILHQKQEPLSIITQLLNQYPNIKTQISKANQPLEIYENSTVVVDDMLLSKQETNTDLFFT